MGARLTAFENRANVEMEIRVFVPPDRPDRYRMIIRVKPGEVRNVLTKRLCNCEEYFASEPDNHIFLMVFMDGIYTGVTLLPWEVKKYAKIIGYSLDDFGVILKGVKFTFTSFFRLNCHKFAIERPKAKATCCRSAAPSWGHTSEMLPSVWCSDKDCSTF